MVVEVEVFGLWLRLDGTRVAGEVCLRGFMEVWTWTWTWTWLTGYLAFNCTWIGDSEAAGNRVTTGRHE